MIHLETRCDSPVEGNFFRFRVGVNGVGTEAVESWLKAVTLKRQAEQHAWLYLARASIGASNL